MDDASRPDGRSPGRTTGPVSAADRPPELPPRPVPARPGGRGAGPALFALGILGVPLLAVAVVFLPLILALFEAVSFRTNYVGEFCDRIGIAGFLEMIYEPVLDPFRPLLNRLLA